MSLNRIEFVKNPEPRCPIVLLLDTSSSMADGGINQLNAGVMTFKQELERDISVSVRVEIAIITFNDYVQKVQDFITINQFIPPQLIAEGYTAMGQAIELALDEVENRKATYKHHGIPYYQPWVFLITDGAPTDSWQSAASRVREAVAANKLSFFAVGVANADMQILSQIAPPNIPPVKLDGLKFRELFRWLSASLKRVSSSKVGGGQVELPPIGWAQVRT